MEQVAPSSFCCGVLVPLLLELEVAKHIFRQGCIKLSWKTTNEIKA
jgi:hypothetical protein